MRRVATLSAVVLIGSALFTFTASRPLAPSSLKGFRAVLFQGEPMEGVVRIGDIDMATELYGKVVNGWMKGVPVKAGYTSVGKPCVGIHFIRLDSRTTYLPTDALHAGDAAHTYWFYQASGDEPAVFMTGRILDQELADELVGLGVPVKATKPASGRCEFLKKGP